MKAPDDSAKAMLIEAGKKAFAERGFSETTIRLLAKRANVNIGAISYYFGGKEGLYRACLEPFAQQNMLSIETILKTPNSQEDFESRLRVFVEHFIEMQLKDFDVCHILERDFPDFHPVTQDVFTRSFEPIGVKLTTYFAEAKAAGFLKSHMDPEIIFAVMMSTLTRITRLDRMRAQLKQHRFLTAAEKANTYSQIVDMVCYGILASSPTTVN